MNVSPREAIDYSRSAQRLAMHRADQDPAKRWDLYREFHEEWGYDPASSAAVRPRSGGAGAPDR
jgi:hypothetical protein